MFRVIIEFVGAVPSVILTVDAYNRPNMTGVDSSHVGIKDILGVAHYFLRSAVLHVTVTPIATAQPTTTTPYGYMHGVAPNTPLNAPAKPAHTVNTGGMATDFGAIADAMRKKGIN